MLSQQQWKRVNKRRLELIEKRIEESLNDEEAGELQLLQQMADQQLASLDAKMQEDISRIEPTSRKVLGEAKTRTGEAHDDAKPS